MKDIFDIYDKKSDFLVCIDSDGCAMNTMEVKHRNCFAPEMIKTWELFENEEYILNIWFDLNLYTRTRGINRFKGLVETFKVIRKEGIYIDDLDSIIDWVENTDELSNKSLLKQIEKNPYSKGLKMTYDWSLNVNKSIESLPKGDEPFKCVEKCLDKLSNLSDVVVVSSANNEALNDEWKRHNFTKYIRALLGQEEGTKKICIGKLKEKGYDANNILMVGDALGDLEAAQHNGVKFYPILVGKEEFSWDRLVKESIYKLLSNDFDDDYQNKLIKEFYDCLK